MYSALQGKRLLIMGGTRISCEIITHAQEMGVFVGVTDYNDISMSPGKRIADAAYDVSTTDVDAMVDLIKRENYDGVLVGYADVLLPYYADICEKAGVPAYGTRKQFEVFINKDCYKSLCRKFGVPTVDEYIVEMDNFEETTKDIVYPVMVKPVDSSGARGITVCQSHNELRDALEKAQSFSRSGRFMVERYLTGKEITVFWVFKDGEYYLTTIGNRHVKHNQEGVIPLPVGYTFPADITEKYIEEIVPNAKKMFKHMDIRNGMMFMQCKVEDGVCVVYDIGYRLTASLEYEILDALDGYNPMKMMIHFALTGDMGEPELEKKIKPLSNRYAFNVSLLSAPGKIADFVGYDEVLKQPGVLYAFVSHFPGEEITEAMKGLLAQITMRVVGVADGLDELKERMYAVYDATKIISDNGENLLLKGMEPEDFEDVLK